MVPARATNRLASIAEEKKDCEDYCYYDPPQSVVAEGTRHDALKKYEAEALNDRDDFPPVPETQKRPDAETRRAAASAAPPRGPPAGKATEKSPLLLVACAAGITSSYLWCV